MKVIAALATLVVGASMCACAATSRLFTEDDAPIAHQPVSVDTVVFADDGRSVCVNFIGGKEFDPDDPCSLAYRGTTEIVGEELELGIYAEVHPKPLPPDTACTGEGHSRTLTLHLDEPFTGAVVRDLAGQVFMLVPPAGLVRIGALPEGWELRREGNVLGSPTPRWERVWSPVPDPWPNEGVPMITLIQSFDGPVSTTGGDLQPAVEVNGESATFYLHRPTGEMVIVWELGDDEVALVGNLDDFSLDEFIEVAESVTLPSD